MSNEPKDLELEGEGENLDTKNEGEEGGAENKAKLTPEQIRGIKQRNLTKLAKELGVEIAKPNSQPAEQSQNKEFDYVEKLFLKANGISKDEYEFVKEMRATTGKSIDELIDNRFFQSELKELRNEKAAKDAIPSSSRRAGNTARDSEDYWLNKGELPEDPELRRKVVNAKIKRESSKSMFSDNPVIGK